VILVFCGYAFVISALVIIVYLWYRLNLMPMTSFFILILLYARIFPQVIRSG
jgi:hypothetical protein